MAFTRSDLDHYLAHSTLKQEARRYVLDATNGPSRNIGTTGFRTLVSEYASRKMGTSIPTESRTGELAYAIFLEYSNDVLAYYEQPPAVDCIRTDRIGRTGVRTYHPDFLVLRRDSVDVIQIKTREQAQKFVSSRKVDWILDGEEVRDLPAEHAFNQLGLPHRVICSDALRITSR